MQKQNFAIIFQNIWPRLFKRCIVLSNGQKHITLLDWINHYSADSAVCFPHYHIQPQFIYELFHINVTAVCFVNTYPLDSDLSDG